MIFHWTPERIISHLSLSYIAFYFEKEVEIRLEAAAIQGQISHGRIRNTLNSMRNTITISNFFYSSKPLYYLYPTEILGFHLG